MSAAKENPCGKFQANIFNNSKCQNCFKPRESHLLNDKDLTQAKPIYAGWLLLAPDGTHLDNPVHRSRKWQWRFFILYKHGLLRYALDEMVWKDSPSDFWERGLLEISREGMMSPSTLTRASVRTTGESLFALQSWIISGKRKKDRQFSHLKVVNQNTSAG
ncbi:myosin phosphatase Rho-interacting protein-like isoform X2 [Equus caballus]|uniref:myosin phosphatase Rho-interacting protein-like isoform X2 n=1 Tax=Equus caballus TaxID=9796 RepID=UPI0038B2A9AB